MNEKLKKLFRIYELQTNNVDITKNRSESIYVVELILNELISDINNVSKNINTTLSNYGLYTAELDWLNISGDKTKQFGYIHSYKLAGDYLVNYSEGVNADLMVQPVLFNYMQYIELLFKNIIKVNGGTPQITHDLLKIWNVTKQYVQKELSNEQFIIIDEIINALFTKYPNSMNFRYKEDLRGNESVNNDYKIDLYVLKIWIQIIDTILFDTYGN